MRNKSLTFKLVFFVVSSVGLIFSAAFGYDYYFSREALLRSVEENALHLTGSTVNRIETVLFGIQKIPRQMATWVETGLCRGTEIQKIIRTALIGNPEIFGSAVAFEPFAFQPAKRFYAPYGYRDKDQSIKTVFLGGDGLSVYPPGLVPASKRIEPRGLERALLRRRRRPDYHGHLFGALQ